MLLSISTATIGGKCDYEKAIRRIAKAGFDGFDITLQSLHSTPEDPFNQENYHEYIDHLKDVMKEVGIVCNQCHGPYPVAAKGWDKYNELMKGYVERSLEVASALGAKNVVLHPVKENKSHMAIDGLDEEFIPFENSEEMFEFNLQFFRSIIPLCEKYNIKVAIENLYINDKKRNRIIASSCGKAEDYIRFFDALNSKWISGCYDIGHGALADEEPQDAIRKIGNRITALHIHDNNYLSDQHKLPYTESINWHEVCKALKDINYQGDFTYECDPFIKKFPDDFKDEVLSFACRLGRYMIKKIEE